MTIRIPTRSAALLASTWVLLPGAVRANAEGASPAAPPLASINISFKLDARLSGPTYGGERWVSPPVYSGASAQETVEARARGVDAKGRPMEVSPLWTAADPGIATVAPARGQKVRITVHRDGETRLRVESHGVSKELLVRAKHLGKDLQVEILQLGPGRQAAPAARDPSAPGTRAVPGLEGRRERQSYALGMSLARTVRSKGVEVAPDLVARGMRDALSGETLLTEEEGRLALGEIKAELRSKQAAPAPVGKGKKAELAVANQEAGAAFLAENRAKAGVVTLPSGLQYQVLEAGGGRTPSPDDVVECHYRGTRIDGTEFDSSRARGKPASFALARVIPGWREALTHMPVGSRWRLVIPPELAYGERGLRGRKGAPQRIGPNETLVYEVELLAIKGPPEPGGAQRTAAAATASPQQD